MVSSVHSTMYAKAKEAGSQLIQGEGAWAGITSGGKQGQVLVAKTANGYIAVDESGNVEQLGAAANANEAAAKAKQILETGKNFEGKASSLQDLAGFSQEMQAKLRNGANGSGAVAPTGDSNPTSTQPTGGEVTPNSEQPTPTTTPTQRIPQTQEEPTPSSIPQQTSMPKPNSQQPSTKKPISNVAKPTNTETITPKQDSTDKNSEEKKNSEQTTRVVDSISNNYRDLVTNF